MECPLLRAKKNVLSRSLLLSFLDLGSIYIFNIINKLNESNKN